ncbi:ubiquinone/menaquinone biosynthesis methyltransferase UbiE [Salinarchaeum sp. Harcht-Bsk1]|uniref:class I SAM-dependent methyltransferase n=1 Tax=Salinarchaeum sp. Harcht-Bsk1 TaxID=1333523 RepID=UPI0003422D47|nr:class I SAM-dependent methyltransferase [Salinarchaeum sp. Harcht-Bsk1]AGN01511.1 ubiquinone/menaquinone biosynthesis methyltransferase UbiE [Salinarchaeum sp. Harcht-Bsk1]
MSDPDTIATYESVAVEYRERHADRSVVAEIVDAFLDALTAGTAAGPASDTNGGGEPDEPRVLDVGCGPGWESATFADAGHDVLGIDLTSEFLDAAANETAPTADFARMDMRRLGFVDATFHGLWACASFLHVPRENAPATLAGFERVLTDGGVLALSVKRGDGTRPGDGYDDDQREFVLYQPGEFRELVEDAGFTVETVDAREYWIFLLARC